MPSNMEKILDTTARLCTKCGASFEPTSAQLKKGWWYCADCRKASYRETRERMKAAGTYKNGKNAPGYYLRPEVREHRRLADRERYLRKKKARSTTSPPIAAFSQLGVASGVASGKGPDTISSAHLKENRHKYNTSEKGRASHRSFAKTPKGRESKRIYMRKKRERMRAMIKAAKDRPCHDCGRTFHTCCMDLHHLDPKLKRGKFSNHSFRTLKTLEEEIAKCVALCAICHRLRHMNDIYAERSLNGAPR